MLSALETVYLSRRYQMIFIQRLAGVCVRSYKKAQATKHMKVKYVLLIYLNIS